MIVTRRLYFHQFGSEWINEQAIRVNGGIN
jgi:hypothetical protein